MSSLKKKTLQKSDWSKQLHIIEISQPLAQERLLSEIAKKDPECAQWIRDNKLTTTNLLKWPPHQLAKLLQKMSPSLAAIFIKQHLPDRFQLYKNLLPAKKYQQLEELIQTIEHPDPFHQKRADINAITTARSLEK